MAMKLKIPAKINQIQHWSEVSRQRVVQVVARGCRAGLSVSDLVVAGRRRTADRTRP